MRRAFVLIGLLALAACGRPAPKPVEAAKPALTSAETAHNWASVKDRQYLYYPRSHDQAGTAGAAAGATTVRYLGRDADGAYSITEIQDGAELLASCVLPCTQVRMRGKGVDELGPFGGDSVTRSALDDAIHGRLEVYPSAAPPLK